MKNDEKWDVSEAKQSDGGLDEWIRCCSFSILGLQFQVPAVNLFRVTYQFTKPQWKTLKTQASFRIWILNHQKTDSL